MSDVILLPISVEHMAEALLARNELRLQLLVQEWLRSAPAFPTLAQPQTTDPRILAVAAALIELFAARAAQHPPAWTTAIGALPEPFFVMRRAERPGFTRDLCLNESPEPLRRHNIFAPPNFLHLV